MSFRLGLLTAVLVAACSGGESAATDPSATSPAATGGETESAEGTATLTAAGAIESTDRGGDHGAEPGALPGDAEAEAPADGTYRQRVAADGPARGAAEPLVTIVQFCGFQDVFCARVRPALQRVLQAHPDEVRWVFRHYPLPFHDSAIPAAEAALEARAQRGDAGFWAMHDLLYENQQALSRTDLEAYAERAGLDMTRFRRALDDRTHRDAVEQDLALAQRLEIRGTPSHFVNGRQVLGAQPYGVFEGLVGEEIDRAREMLATGTARANLYSAFMRNAHDRPPPRPEEPAGGGPAPDAEPRRSPDPAAVYHVPIGDEPSLGPRDALVTIVEFADFECPFCKRARSTMEELLRRYPRDVRLVWMNNPLQFHRNAMRAAIAALEAYAQGGSRRFWQMHQRLYDHQEELTREMLERLAGEARLNLPRLRRALDQEAHRTTIEAQQELARSLGASGTPSFFINGRNVRGAQPVDVFVAVIEEELTRAREIVARGVPRRRVYQEAVRDGATSPQWIDAPAPAASQGEPEARRYVLQVPSGRPTLGPADAPVVIQEMMEFQGPFCARVLPTLRQIRDHYGDRVRFVYRNYPLPFHQHSQLAAEAAHEVFLQRGNDDFWRYHDRLYANQDALTRPDLERYAQELGRVDMARFRRALDQRTHRALVEGDVQAVTDAGATIGTPSFFIDDELVQGAQPFEMFRGVIDRHLAGRR